MRIIRRWREIEDMFVGASIPPRVRNAVQVLTGGEVGGERGRGLIPGGMLELNIVVPRGAVHGNS